MMRPVLTGLSKVCEGLDMEPLDSVEKETGAEAFAALAYQSGALLDGRVLVALWIAGVMLPRAVQRIHEGKHKAPALPVPSTSTLATPMHPEAKP